MALRGSRLVGEVAATVPGAIEAFRAAGIDCCRDARLTLEDASLRAGIRIGRLAAMLFSTPTLGAGPDWREASLRSLIRHIVQTVHPDAAASMERLSTATAGVAQSVPNDRSIGEIRSAFSEVANNLVIHIWRVEHEGFPLLERLEDAQSAGVLHLTSEDFPDPHDPMLEGLRRLRAITEEYSIPTRPPAMEELLAALQSFDTLLHRHIHLEHHVLYPRAAALCARPPGSRETAADLICF